MHVIGVDLGLTSGVSCWTKGEGIIDFCVIKKHKADLIPYSLFFRQELKNFCDKHEPYIMVYERPAMGGHSTVHSISKLSIFLDALEVFIFENKVESYAYTPQEIKRYYCGIMKARKEEVRAAMKLKNVPIPTDQEDVLDSIAFIYYHVKRNMAG